MKLKRLSTFLAAGAVLAVLTFSANSFGQPDTLAFCHENAPGKFEYLVLPINAAINAHGYNPATNSFSSGPGADGHATDYPAPGGASDCEGDGPTDPGGNPDPVPEPITMLLFGAGIAGVGYATRRLRKKGDTESDIQD